jgi:hypothetical protein
MMMGRVLEMQGKASIYCVILITALDAQVGLLPVNRREIFSTDNYHGERTKKISNMMKKLVNYQNRVSKMGQLEESKTDVS